MPPSEHRCLNCRAMLPADWKRVFCSRDCEEEYYNDEYEDEDDWDYYGYISNPGAFYDTWI